MEARQAVSRKGYFRRTRSTLLKARATTSTTRPAVVVARVEAIVIDGGWLQGGSDGRGAGKAAGY